MLINTARGIVKPFGCKLPRCDTDRFADKMSELELPDQISSILGPLLTQIRYFSEEISKFDKELKDISRTSETQTRFMEVPGIGPVIALAFMQHLGDPNRFTSSAAVGKYLGLTAGRRFSGGSGYRTSITKARDSYMRSLMTQAAQGFLRVNRESDLKRWADSLMIRMGGKVAKKKIIIAVARKLAVLLHRLWITGETYEPFHHSGKKGDISIGDHQCLPATHGKAGGGGIKGLRPPMRTPITS